MISEIVLSNALSIVLSVACDVIKESLCVVKNILSELTSTNKLYDEISSILKEHDYLGDKKDLSSSINKKIKKDLKKSFSKNANINDIFREIDLIILNELKESEFTDEESSIIIKNINLIILETIKEKNRNVYDTYKLDEIYNEVRKQSIILSKKIDLITRDYENIKTIDQYEEWLKKAYNKNDFMMTLDFFEVDDKDFLDSFPKKLNDDYFCVIHNDIDEALGCVLYTLKKLKIDKDIYVVSNQKTWDNLEDSKLNAILLAGFKTDKIKKISNCICIFFSFTPFSNNYIQLRKRKIDTLEQKLIDGKYNRDEANSLLYRTNGLFSGIQYFLFSGEMNPFGDLTLNIKTKKALLLVKGFTFNDCDIDFISETFFLNNLEFKDKVIELCCIQNNSFLYEKSRYGSTSYTLSNFEAAWYNLGNHIIKEDFELLCCHFFDALKQYFVKNCYSNFLMKSILEMIDFVVCVYHKEWQNLADAFVEDLLNELLNNVLFLCEHFYELGLLIVDIAPSIFVEFCSLNISKLKVIFEGEYSNQYTFYSSQYRTLVWLIGHVLQFDDGQYAKQCIYILMEMRAWNVKEQVKYAEEQIIKCLWPGLNLSGLNDIERENLLENLIEEYKEDGWNIAYKSITASSIFFSSGSTLYRNIALDYDKNRVVNQRLYNSYCNILKNNASSEGLLKMIFEYPLIVLSKDDLLDICGKIEKQINQYSDFDKFEYEFKLRKRVFDIQYFERSYFKGLNDVVDKMINIFSTIQYKNKLMKYLYCLCYSTNNFPILNPTPYKDNDIRSNQTVVDLFLENEYNKIKEEGYSLSELLKLYLDYFEYKNKSSYPIIDNLISLQKEFDVDVFNVFINKSRFEDAASYFYFTLSKKSDYTKLVLEITNENVKGIVLSYTRNYTISFFDKIKNETENVKSIFWSRFVPKLENKDIAQTAYDSFPLRDITTEQLLFLLLNYMYFESSLIIDECLHNTNCLKQEDVRYYVKEFLDYCETNLDDSLLEKLAKLEYYAFGESQNRYLCLYFLKFPSSYCDFLSNFHECKKKDKNFSIEMATTSYSINFYLKFCPGEISSKLEILSFDEWIEKFKQCFKEYQFDTDVETIIGHLLPYSKINNDGLPLQESVRKYIEHHYSKALRNSFWVTENNKRGVFTPNGGESTFALAREYFEISNKFKNNGLSSLASLYKKIGQSYENEAKMEREDSENV